MAIDAEGYRMRGFTRDEAIPMTGDQWRHQAEWEHKSLKDLPAGKYSLREHLKDSDFYALTLSK